MKLVSRLFAVLGLFCALTSVSLADETPTCPSAEMIKQDNFLRVTHAENGYVVVQADTFGTSQLWGFGIGPFLGAHSEDEAKDLARRALESLSGEPTAIPVTGIPTTTWICNYNVDGPYLAVAVTPFVAIGSLSQAVESHVK